MTAYEKARNTSRQFKSLTSLSIEKFDLLLPTLTNVNFSDSKRQLSHYIILKPYEFA